MAEVKWIKIVTEFFDDEKIKLIEAMPESDMILIIWIKLLTLAGKKNVNGYIFLTENIPYTDEMLATLFGRPLNTIRLALDVFKKFKMININKDNVIKIINWEKHQNIEGLDKIREQNRLRQERKRGLDQLLIESGENKDICIYCGKESKLTIDHIIPLTKGGKNDINNKILCCLDCNQSKNNRDLADFLNEKIRMNYLININSIIHNKKLMQVIEYKNGKFIQCHTSSRDSHSTDKIRIDKNRLELEKINNIYTHWNNQKIKVHRKNIYHSNIKTALNKYSEKEIITAITNYRIILKGEYCWTYIWALSDFLQRGIDKFLDLEIAKNNYKIRKNKKKESPEDNMPILK